MTARQQRAEPLLPHPLDARLHQGPLRGQLRPVASSRPESSRPRASCGEIRAICRCGGSRGTTTAPGFKRSTRVSRALVIRQLARAAATCCCKSKNSAWARSTSISATSPLARPVVLRTSTSALATASSVPAKRPRACCTSKYAAATASRASFRAVCRSASPGRQFLAVGQRPEDGVGDAESQASRRRPPQRRVLLSWIIVPSVDWSMPSWR